MAIDKKLYKSLFLLFILIILAIYLSFQKDQKEEHQIIKVEFSELPGWTETDILASIKSFENSCKALTLKNYSPKKEFFKLNINKESYLNFCELLSITVYCKELSDLCSRRAAGIN